MEEEEKMVGAVGEEWQEVAQKRKAWAKSRDSWQASEAERLSPEPAAAAAAAALAAEQELCGAKLPLTAEGGQSLRPGARSASQAGVATCTKQNEAKSLVTPERLTDFILGASRVLRR